ncbi:MAG: TonB-dependent receptor [Myxococcota bacterium]|nr:TonB-dependent receptor [Myxococcota bacterium]
MKNGFGSSRSPTRLFAPSGGPALPSLFALGAWAGSLCLSARAHDPPSFVASAADARPHVSDARAPDALGSGEVVVAADEEGPSDPIANAGSVTVLVVDETVSAATDVASLVDGAAGTTVVQLGGLGDFSAVSLRGSTLRQVQVHLDGIPLNPDGGEVVNLSELPLAAFSQVEVWRSAPPPALLAGPIGGVINLVTGEHPGGTRVAATGGSLGTARVSGFGAGATQLRGTPVDGVAFVDHFSTRGDFDYLSDRGTLYNLLDDRRLQRANNDKGQLSVHGRTRLGSDRLRLTLLDAVLRREEGLPGHANMPAGSARLETNRNLAVAQVDARGGRARGWGRAWLLTRRETLDDRAGEIGIGTQHQQTDTASLGLATHGRVALGPHAVPTVTASGRIDQVAIDDLLTGTASDPRRRFAVQASASADIILLRETLVVSPVVLGQHQRYNASDAMTVDGTAITRNAAKDLWRADPRLGMRYRPLPGLAVKATGGRYLRAPDFTELFGDRGAMIGNPDLEPETGWAWDIGAAGRADGADWGAVSGEIAHFWRASQDLIVWSQNSQRTMVPVNVGEAWVQGLEFSGTLDLLGAVDLDASLTRTVSVNLVPRAAVANNQLPRIPPWEAWIGTSIHHREAIRIGHGWSYTAPNYWDATNYFLTPARSLHDAFIRVAPAPAVSLEAAVRNLANRRVEVVDRDPLDDTSDARRVQALNDFTGYPLPGRTFLFTLTWTG